MGRTIALALIYELFENALRAHGGKGEEALGAMTRVEVDYQGHKLLNAGLYKTNQKSAVI
jgi:hypothetical protein